MVAALAAAVYAPTMRNLYAGDDVLIAKTESFRRTAPLATIFDRSYFALYNQDTYRPVATLSSLVDHRLGVSPIHAGHAQNIVWHAGTSALVAKLAARLLPPGAALFAAVFFALHPAATEPVVSVGYREDAIVGFFAVASVLLALRGGPRARLSALACYALALFTKENAIVLPALLVLVRVALAAGQRLDRGALARELAMYGVVTAGYLAVRFGVMASPDEFADPAGGTYADTFVAVPRIFAHYLRLLIVPWPLVAAYAHMFPLGASLVSQLPWLALDLAFFAGAAWLAKARPVLGLGLLWFAVALVPTLHLVPMRVPAADRFMYLPLVGGALAAGALLSLALAAAQRPVPRRALGAGAAAALCAFLVLTERRIPAWHDDLTLSFDTLKHNPRSYLAHYTVSGWYAGHGQPARAGEELEAALANCPRESRFGRLRFCAYFATSLGMWHLEQNHRGDARARFTEALALVDDYVPAIVGLGYAALADGDLVTARRHAQWATALGPREPIVRKFLAGFRDDLEQREDAEREAPAAAQP